MSNKVEKFKPYYAARPCWQFSARVSSRVEPHTARKRTWHFVQEPTRDDCRVAVKTSLRVLFEDTEVFTQTDIDQVQEILRALEDPTFGFPKKDEEVGMHEWCRREGNTYNISLTINRLPLINNATIPTESNVLPFRKRD